MNQWKTWQRSLFLCALLFVLWCGWYFFLEKPLLKKHGAAAMQLTQATAVLKALKELFILQGNFVYKNDLNGVSLQQFFQAALSSAPGLVMASFTDNPALPLSAGAGQFASVGAVLGVSLLSVIHQSPSTIVFSGKFPAFVAYLKALQTNNQLIYFDSIDFDMNRYPVAKVTMKVFTLGE